MSIRSLHLLGSPVLRERAKPVPAVDDTVRQFVDDLFDTMHAAKGVGLAANQVGVPLRVAGGDVGEDSPDPLVLINPVVSPRGVLIETAGSIAATLHAYPMGKIAMGIELSVSHHRGVREGLITCTVTALSLGKTLATYQAEIVDADGARVATGRLTCVLREGRAS